MVAADIYRPAAIKQLTVLGEQIQVPVLSMGEQDPVDIAKAAVSHSRTHNNNVVIIDTAGRLHVDEQLMDELVQIQAAVSPKEILLVVDAMTGQDAVNVAQSFNEQLGIDGVILTKLDGDARGGAALSVKAVTGKPIKFVGVSEKMDGLEPFHPDRMASRILGMGDMLTLIEKAVATVDEEKAQKLATKIKEADFTLEDFQEQLQQVKQMGPLDQLLGMMPGMGSMKQLKNLDVDDSHLKKIEAIIDSMTLEERRNQYYWWFPPQKNRPWVWNKGSDVNRCTQQFEQTRQMLKQFAGPPKGRKKSKGMFSLFR